MNLNKMFGGKERASAKAGLEQKFDALSPEQRAMAVEVYRTEIGDALATPLDEAGLRAHLESISSDKKEEVEQMEALWQEQKLKERKKSVA